jgi:hypothetical protein
VIDAFAPHLGGSDAAKLGVKEFDEACGGSIAALPQFCH